MKNRNVVAVVNLIRCLPLNALKDAEVVANLVRAFGIMDWGPNMKGPEMRFMIPWSEGMGAAIGQTPDQVAKLLVYLSTFEINTFCEIGICFGGNFLFVSEYLRRFNPSLQSLGVDNSAYLNDEVREHINGESWMSLLNSTSDKISGQVFDFVFIDADHVAPWPEKDYVNVGQFAKICAFHDLQDPNWPDVGVYWNTLKGDASKTMLEFLEDPSDSSTHGIGIIHERGIL